MGITIIKTASHEQWFDLPRHQAISAMVCWMWVRGLDEKIIEVIER